MPEYGRHRGALVDTDGPRIGAAIKKTFPHGLPAMSWIFVAGLFHPDVKVEIEAIAAVV